MATGWPSWHNAKGDWLQRGCCIKNLLVIPLVVSTLAQFPVVWIKDTDFPEFGLRVFLKLEKVLETENFHLLGKSCALLLQPNTSKGSFYTLKVNGLCFRLCCTSQIKSLRLGKWLGSLSLIPEHALFPINQRLPGCQWLASRPRWLNP